MPKKLNTNPKAAEARERKETQKKDKLNSLVKQVEDEKWADEGTTKAEQKKRADEQKRLAEAEKRAGKKAAAAADQAELDRSLAAQKKVPKVTAFEMQLQQQKSLVEQRKLAEQREADKKKIISQPDISDDADAVRNVNQHLRDMEREREEKFGGSGNVIEATGIDAALDQLSNKLNDTSIDLSDRHPEKRLKAAFKAYEEVQWPILKSENSGLRHSQLKELLWQQWLKSSENPLNQAKT